ncbi:MAG: hypothetical protein ACPHCI_09735, partial [Solirubrobacterales bacterium]
MNSTETATATSASAPRSVRAAGMLGFGGAQPSRVVSSEEVAARYDLTADWIIERTGVESRRVLDVEQGESLLDLVLASSR